MIEVAVLDATVTVTADAAALAGATCNNDATTAVTATKERRFLRVPIILKLHAITGPRRSPTVA